MTELEYTLITLIACYLTYSWGRKEGIAVGIKATIDSLYHMGAIDDDVANKFVDNDEE
jgi:hypothetical protein